MMRCCFAALALLGGLACGGSEEDVTVTGSDSDSLASSPGGAATLALVNIESIRPDDLNLAAVAGASGAVKPAPVSVGCRTFNTVLDATTRTTTITYATCKAASGWTLTGTVVFKSSLIQQGAFSSVYDLHSQDPTGTKIWAYSGTKLVAINAAQQTATLTVPAGTYLTVAYQDTQDPSKSRTYHYVPDLAANWATQGQFRLMGSYAFQQVGGPALSATVASNAPLIWTPACCFPTSGTIALASGDANATAVFGPECGGLKLNGASLPMTCQ